MRAELNDVTEPSNGGAEVGAQAMLLLRPDFWAGAVPLQGGHLQHHRCQSHLGTG